MKNNVCKICNCAFKQLGNHIKTHGYTLQRYFDEFLAKEGDGICFYCGGITKFYNDLSRGYSKYCSNKCSAFGENKGKWMLGKKASKETCDKLSKKRKGKSYEEIYGKTAIIEKLKRKIGNRKRWLYVIKKNDIRPKHNGDYRYTEWRKKVFIRDNYICQKCGDKRYIEAHHIKLWSKYPKLRYKVNNGITLCKCCHKKEHKKCKIK